MRVAKKILESIKKWEAIRQEFLWKKRVGYHKKYWNACGYCEVFSCTGSLNPNCPLSNSQTRLCYQAKQALLTADLGKFDTAVTIADKLLERMYMDYYAASRDPYPIVDDKIPPTTVAEVESIQNEGEASLCDMLEKCREDRRLGPSADSPIVTNEKGGQQSALKYRLDLLDPKAMFRLGNVLHEGIQKYAKDNWRLIDTESHLNHAMGHILAYLDSNDEGIEDHLGHAMCRVMMAIGVEEE